MRSYSLLCVISVLAACTKSPPPAADANSPAPSAAPGELDAATPSVVAPSTASAPQKKLVIGACKLPEPRKSDDVCKVDSECDVSEPCHAHACVAKSKSHPRTKDTMCTQILECETADANRCGCLDGRCALIPPP